MTPIRRILCPTDFSEFSRRALDHAITVAHWSGAEITVAHAYPYSVIGGGAPYFPSGVAMDASTRARLTGELETAADAVRASGLKADVALLEGDPSNEIVTRARTSPTDLVVMGTHGLRGFDRFMVGSVAARVVQRAPCAVLTVPQPPEGAPPAGPLGAKILCPVDLEDSDATLETAFSIKAAAEGHLVLLHVLDDLGQYQAAAGLARIDWAALRGGLEQEAVQRLCRAARTAGKGATAESLVLSGKPYREILHAASSRGASLVVMGIHGRNPIERLFLGSTTLHVLRQAPCPIWTVRTLRRIEP
jgi:nucleotide-binding universal stress UspA family protein